MISYELWLHYKQGDDLASIVEKTDSSAAAFAEWADHFEARRDVCRQIARALEGKNVRIHAGTHHISFEPGDDEAEGVLKMLVREEILHTHDWDDED